MEEGPLSAHASDRALLGEKYSPASVDKALSALRDALETAHRLGLMSTEHFHRAVDVESVGGSRLPRGRALTEARFRKRAVTVETRDDRAPIGKVLASASAQ